MTQTQKRASLAGTVFVAVIIVFFVGPIAQDPNYHNFADQRLLFDIPNFGDVVSNVFFLVVGGYGVGVGLQSSYRGGLIHLRKIYIVFFLGIFLTGFGSAYYHWSPNTSALVWDRLPMTIAFMSLFSLVIGEQLSTGLGQKMFGPLIVFGVFSIAYWHFTEQKGMGDLRIYLLVQFLPVLLIPLLLLMFTSPFTSTVSIWCAIVLYLLAKIFELSDFAVYRLGMGFSGHSIKHVLAAFGAGSILWGLLNRKAISI